MSDFLYNKIDFIIMIILALLVAFIIGFNIIQVIDSKLSSVTINVPSPNCQLPPIYLTMDENTNDVKYIKLGDIASINSNETNETNKKISDENINNKNIQKENFGNIQSYPLIYDDNRKILISNTINENTGLEVINSKSEFDKKIDSNYNTVNDIPLLVAPDTNVPNRAGPTAKGYYSSKVKLIKDPNSTLMKLAKSNEQKINETIAKCNLNDLSKIPEINGTFNGYNAFVDLRTDSYANITSIGKSMLTPYTSYPVPS